MLQIEQNKKALIHAFANLSTNITFQNKQGYLDINHSMEQALTTLLNRLFNLSLINLNTIKHNHPAIDLGDDYSGVAVQVTSDGSNSKFNETLDKYIKHGLDIEYSEVWFLIISNDLKGSIQRAGFNTKVMNLGDLAKSICEQDEATFTKLFEYTKKQFSTYFSIDDTVNPLEVKPLPSKSLSNDISNFIDANNFDYDIRNEYTTLDVIKSDLLKLKNTLAEMNEHQRWFIYRVLSEARNSSDSAGYYLPLSTLENGLSQSDKNDIHSIFESLEHKEMAWFEEDDFHLNTRVVGVCFNASVEEVDYLSAIRKFLEDVNQISDLRDVILKCNFSHIN